MSCRRKHWRSSTARWRRPALRSGDFEFSIQLSSVRSIQVCLTRGNTAIQGRNRRKDRRLVRTSRAKTGMSPMKLDRELRHKSEDIQDTVLMDVVGAIRRRVRIVNRNYDIPYIAGYSQDGRTVFIDRHLPRTFRWLMKTVRVEPFLMTHEIGEKALLDELRLHYLHAHQIAVRAERDAVKASGVSWWAYQRFMKQHERVIEEERLIRVPATLDLTPYRDERDFALLHRLVQKERARLRRSD